MILVGDIGGTNTRLALAESTASGIVLHQIERFATPTDLPPLLADYLARHALTDVQAVALCGAGPVRADGSLQLSNHPCLLDPAAIAAATVGRPMAAAVGGHGPPYDSLARPSAAPVLIVNDFEAVALAVPAFADSDLRTICHGAPVDTASRLVLGPGTGLGVASLIPHGSDWIVCPGEGGHVDLAPVDDEELAAFLKLRAAYGALSVESLLSGGGFVRLHAVLADADPLEPAAIVSAAANGDENAIAAMRLFARWLGRVAGNAALTVGARGGVYIAGGIVPAWGELFDIGQFRAGFIDKRGFESWLSAIPAHVVTHPQPGLLGLARLGLAAAGVTQSA